MLIYSSLLIPIIVTAVCYFFYKKQYVWWELVLPLVVTLIGVVIAKAIIDKISVQATEYLGSNIVAAYEQEPYNYWKHETCTQTYACGTDSKGHVRYCTRTYDCSHQEDVSPSWYVITDGDEQIEITEAEYEKIKKRFATKPTIVEENRNYDSHDYCTGSKGTKFEGKRVGEVSYVYEVKWDGSDKTRKAYVSTHTYENRIKASDATSLNISVVSDELADSLGLYKYPEYGEWFSGSIGVNYPTILGKNITPEIQELFRSLNGKYGKSKQFRLWILVFDNKPSVLGEYQENYWCRGNKNELVICIGRKNNEITWSHAFSWSKSEVLTADVKNKVFDLYTYKDSIITKQNVVPVVGDVKNKVLGKVSNNLPIVLLPTNSTSDTIKVKSKTPVLTDATWNELYNYLDNNITRFERRDFEEFDYLIVEPSTTSIIIVYIISIIISILVNIFAIKNDIND